MKLKKSFYNGHVIRYDLMYYGWVVLLYVLLLILSGPIAFLSGSEIFREHMVQLMDFKLNMYLATMSVIPITLALFQFKYLHNPMHIARMHSYPFHRYEILGTKLITGFLVIAIPQVLFFFFTLVFYSSADAMDGQLIHTPLAFMLLSIIYMIGIYLFTVNVSLISGFTISATFMTLIFFLVPYGLLELIFETLQRTMKGFYYNKNTFDMVVLKLSPLTLIVDFPVERLTPMTVFSGIVFCIGLFILSLIVYGKRRDEMAGDIVAFNMLKPVFVVGVTICGIFVFGTYFSSFYQSSFAMFIGFLLGGTLGYYISNMLLAKRFNVFKCHIRGYMLVLAGVVCFQCILHFDIFGFEKRVPMASNVESVVLEPTYLLDRPEGNVSYSDPKVIDEIVELHQKLIAEQVGSSQSKQFYLQYVMKNGTKIKRSYNVDELRYKSIFDVVYNSSEYKKQTYNLFDLNTDNVSMVTIESNEFWNNREKLTSKEDIQQLVQLLKEDILSSGSDELVFNRYEHAHFTFYSTDSNVNINVGFNSITNSTIGDLQDEIGFETLADIPLNSKFKKTKDWLDSKGIFDKIGLKPEGVSYINLEDVESESNAKTILSDSPK